MGVITTNGMREFVRDTGSGDWIAGFDLQLQAAIPHHVVQVMAHNAPEWAVFRAFVG